MLSHYILSIVYMYIYIAYCCLLIPPFVHIHPENMVRGWNRLCTTNCRAISTIRLPRASSHLQPNRGKKTPTPGKKPENPWKTHGKPMEDWQIFIDLTRNTEEKPHLWPLCGLGIRLSITWACWNMLAISLSNMMLIKKLRKKLVKTPMLYCPLLVPKNLLATCNNVATGTTQTCTNKLEVCYGQNP